MVGALQASGRIAAAALLAFGSLAPLEGPLLPARAAVTPMADTSIACAPTVGTATTDPALAADAARAIAVGYSTTDCLPDASLLAAAEARAAIPMDSGTPAQAVVGGSLAGRSSSGAATVATTSTPTAAVTPSPSATPATETTPSATTAPETAATTTAAEESSSGDGSSGTGSSDDEGSGNDSSGNDSSGNDGGPGATPDGSAADGTTTAAGRLGWGDATGIEDFDGDLTTGWSIYDGAGHAGNGRRSPSAMSVSGGIVTITGDANGTTGGMAWKQGRSKYGRWEARVKSPVADPSYNAVMLLWPDAENWPVGGEVDFMEIGDETRQKTDFFLHFGEENHQLHGEVAIDATLWHNWAVEWSPTKITAYVDGTEWFSTTRADALPPGPMHLTLQLDWFPEGDTVQQSAMHVDWVRYYPIDGSGAGSVPLNSPDTTSDAGVTVAPGTGATTTDGGITDPAGDDPPTARGAVAGTTTSATTTVTRPGPLTPGGTSPAGVNPADGSAPVVTGIETATPAVADIGAGTAPSDGGPASAGSATPASGSSASTTAAG